VIPLQTRLRYTTMIVLPDGEEILDVICGDRDFWVISATQNIAHVKPAKAGAATNLNLVTASGAIYSFLLTRRAAPHARPEGVRQRRRPAPDRGAEVLQRRAGEAWRRSWPKRAAARSAERRARPRRWRTFRSSTRRAAVRVRHAKYEKPFLVRAMWHDGQFTYVKSDATELPALYELKDGKPAS
jgi:type IV secretory pathway VirB9-like protein